MESVVAGVHSPWELVGNAHSLAPPMPTESETQGVGSGNLV